MRTLRSALAERLNVALVDESPAVALHTTDGAVEGVVVEQNSRPLLVRAATVVLALDGFAGNQALMKEHCSALGEPFYGGVATSTGDALPWLEGLDAELRNMGSCLRSGLVVVGHGTRVSPSLPFVGAVLLDSDGRRFVDEEAHGYSSLAGLLQQLPGERASMVWDDTAHAATCDSELMRDTIRAGAFRTHDDLSSLAAALGIPEATTAEALAARPGRRQLTRRRTTTQG